jgi:hypothetical protein
LRSNSDQTSGERDEKPLFQLSVSSPTLAWPPITMKISTWVVAALILSSACSPQSETKNSGYFSLDVSNSITTDERTAVEKAFFEKYAKLDTTHKLSGTMVPVDILSYDSLSGQTGCVRGFTILVNQTWIQPADYNGPGSFGEPSKLFFFTGSNYRYQVWNNPITTKGSDEDTQEQATISLDHMATAQCAMLGLKIGNPTVVAGVNSRENITFYYWSEQKHRLIPATSFTIAYSRGLDGQDAVRTYGEIAFPPSASKPYDIEYKVTGDNNYNEMYSWKDGKYVKVAHFEQKPEVDPFDQSAYAIKVDSIGLESVFGYSRSYYPLFRSDKNPAAADAINRVMQLRDLDFLITPSGLGDWKKRTKDQTVQWKFWLNRVNDNLLVVTTQRTLWGDDRKVNPEVYFNRHYFNAVSGDVIFLEDLIKPDQMASLGAGGEDVIINAYPGIEPCDQPMKGAWTRGNILLGMNAQKKQVQFEFSTCDEAEPLHMVTASWQDYSKAWTPYFYQLMDTSPANQLGGISHLWTGKLDGNTSLTMLLHLEAGNKVTGKLIYDNTAKVIPFNATFEKDLLTLNELDGNGNITGTIEAKLEAGMLGGTWTSGSVVKTFTAER